MGCLDKGPVQIAITVFTVSGAFTFSVGQSPGGDAATIGGKVTYFLKTGNITDFQSPFFQRAKIVTSTSPKQFLTALAIHTNGCIC